MRYILHIVLFFVTNISFAQNANTLNPLRKNHPHYFCEKTFDGIITKEGYRVNDSIFGEMRQYEQGVLNTIMHFVNEELNGSYTAYFFPTGNIYLQGFHKNGKKEGTWKEYDVNGKLISTKKYKNDEQIE